MAKKVLILNSIDNGKYANSRTKGGGDIISLKKKFII